MDVQPKLGRPKKHLTEEERALAWKISNKKAQKTFREKRDKELKELRLVKEKFDNLTAIITK